jgi:hypothetical protein
VPGDVITDLYNAGMGIYQSYLKCLYLPAGVIDEPLFDFTWIEHASWWGNSTWTYTKSFTYSEDGILYVLLLQIYLFIMNFLGTDALDVLLVFDGVKMGASVIFNNQPIGVILDQHLRYIYSIKDTLLPGEGI